MMIVGACIFLAVAEPAGLNPLEIADDFVIKCHLSFSKLKRWSRNTINKLEVIKDCGLAATTIIRGH